VEPDPIDDADEPREPPARRGLRRIGTVALPIAVGIAGAWLAIQAFGTESLSLGAFEVRLEAHAGPAVTEIALPPLGKIRADTHLAPLTLRATLVDVDVDRLRSDLVDGPARLAAALQQQAVRSIRPFAVRLLLIGAAGALLLAAMVFRLRPRPVAIATLAAVLALGGVELLTLATYDEAAFREPAYEGTLALAPQLFGPIEGTIERAGYFRAELQRIVTSATRAYSAIEANPLGREEETRILLMGDIHLSALGMSFAKSLAESFDVDAVVDIGDTSSFGTGSEAAILSFVPLFDRPYVWVRGSHDSSAFERAVRRLGNGVVLDGDEAQVAGLTMYGLGDPYFLEARGAPKTDDEIEALTRSAGPRILADVEAMSAPPDLIAVHDRRMAEAVAGRVPLVVSGHFHRDEVNVIDGTIYLEVGTTGGAGPTGFTAEGGTPFSAQILYFRPALPGSPPRLIAWDLIRQFPENGNLTVERHLVDAELGSPSPSPAATPTGATPTGGVASASPYAGSR
jgi:predicted phosphodiesterase